MPGIRRRVQMLSPLQRPEAEGPARRLLFSTEISLDAAPVQVVLDGDKVMLDGGRVRDIEVGDVFVVMPPMSSTVDDGRNIARATVTAVGPVRAAVEVEFSNEATNIPRGALAFPISLNQRRYPVTVAGQGPIVDEIRKAISAASHVRPVEKDDIAITPLAVPMLAGPGAISTAILLRDQANDWQKQIALCVCILMVSLLTFLIFRLSVHGLRWLSPIAMKVTTRIMGLLLAAVAIQFTLNALKDLKGILL